MTLTLPATPMSPLRQRLIEDMNMRLGPKSVIVLANDRDDPLARSTSGSQSLQKTEDLTPLQSEQRGRVLDPKLAALEAKQRIVA